MRAAYCEAYFLSLASVVLCALSAHGMRERPEHVGRMSWVQPGSMGSEQLPNVRAEHVSLHPGVPAEPCPRTSSHEPNLMSFPSQISPGSAMPLPHEAVSGGSSEHPLVSKVQFCRHLSVPFEPKPTAVWQE